MPCFPVICCNCLLQYRGLPRICEQRTNLGYLSYQRGIFRERRATFLIAAFSLSSTRRSILFMARGSSYMPSLTYLVNLFSIMWQLIPVNLWTKRKPVPRRLEYSTQQNFKLSKIAYQNNFTYRLSFCTIYLNTFLSQSVLFTFSVEELAKFLTVRSIFWEFGATEVSETKFDSVKLLQLKMWPVLFCKINNTLLETLFAMWDIAPSAFF